MILLFITAPRKARELLPFRVIVTGPPGGGLLAKSAIFSTRSSVVEGAGGPRVPLNDRDLMIDLMVRLDLPVVLVAANRLGAIGHTLGASGAIILGTLLDELERRNLATGCATLCVGGGMGIATVIERV